MASPGNQHCASCIGTLSFPMWRCGGVHSLVSAHVFYTHQYAVNVGCGRMIRGSHHRCSCLPPLAARPEADRFQGRCADVQSFTWKCAAVSGTIRCCCQSARPTDITLWWHQSSDLASVRRSTVGDRAFSVAGPRVWNTLPEEITTSQSLLTFRQQQKTWLFRKSYPDIII